MRSRIVREGSVGLLVLTGLGLFGGAALWLGGNTLGRQSYNFEVRFTDATGLQMGTPVRYRGVKVGRVAGIRPESNEVIVTAEVSPASLTIPQDVEVQLNQVGLLNEGFIDLVPPAAPLSPADLAANPVGSDCPATIICDGDQLQGEIGISINALFGSLLEFSELYTDPKLFENINQAAQNTATAAQEATKLSAKTSEFVDIAKAELDGLSNSLEQGIATFSTEVTSVSGTLQQATDQVSQAAIQSTESIQQVAAQASEISNQVEGLIEGNRGSIVTTLDNLNQATQQLNSALSSLGPVITEVEQGNFLNNLETVSNNAAEASENLKDFSKTVNDPANLLLLKQTLDSARTTLENIDKVTSDLDDLTGDPQFRDSIRNIIKGLGNILASTQALEQQTVTVQKLDASAQTITHLEWGGPMQSVDLGLSKPVEKD
ncbi:MAG: MlaD family protein [Microcoleaceae cyanobacterium]